MIQAPFLTLGMARYRRDNGTGVANTTDGCPPPGGLGNGSEGQKLAPRDLILRGQYWGSMEWLEANISLLANWAIEVPCEWSLLVAGNKKKRFVTAAHTCSCITNICECHPRPLRAAPAPCSAYHRPCNNHPCRFHQTITNWGTA